MKKYGLVVLVVLLVLAGLSYGVFRYIFPQSDIDATILLPKFVKFEPLTNPDMVSPEQATWLKPDDFVLGVEQNGDARAYPLIQIQYHHIVNDMVGGEPYLGTYCGICSSGVGFKPVISGTRYTFETIGARKAVAIMKDNETGSVWGQFDGVAVGGPASEQRLHLELVPTIRTTWAKWLEMYPQTKVLTWYQQYEAGYNETKHESEIGLKLYPTGFESTMRNRGDTRLAENELIVGVSVGDETRAYPLSDFKDGLTVIPDTLGGQEIVIFADQKTAYGVAYQPMINQQKLVLSVKEGVITDNQGNTWNLNGQAINGPLKGQKFPFITSFTTEWYGWTDYHPQTTIYGR